MSHPLPTQVRRAAIAIAVLAVGLIGWAMAGFQWARAPMGTSATVGAATTGAEARQGGGPKPASAVPRPGAREMQPDAGSAPSLTVKAQHIEAERLLQAQGESARTALIARQIRQLEGLAEAAGREGNSERARLLAKRLSYLKGEAAAAGQGDSAAVDRESPLP